MTFFHLSPKEFFSYEQAHPLVLDLLLFQRFQEEWLEWDPETLVREISEEFVQPSELNWSKVQAVKTVHVNPGAAFSQWEVFLPVITAVNNVIPNFNYLQAPTLPRLYAGTDIMRSLDPEEPFSREVEKFMAASFLHRGVYYAPGSLESIQPLLRRPFYVCSVCNNMEFVEDDHDGYCDYCGKDWRSQATGRVKPDAPRVTPQFTYDETPVKETFDKAVRSPEDFTPHDDIESDVQVSKLLVALEYQAYRRKQFVEQKEFLKL